jgi:hypothetical protein
VQGGPADQITGGVGVETAGGAIGGVLPSPLYATVHVYLPSVPGEPVPRCR